MFGFVVLGLVSPVLAKRLAGKNVSEMTYFVSSGTQTLNSNLKLVELLLSNTQLHDIRDVTVICGRTRLQPARRSNDTTDARRRNDGTKCQIRKRLTTV